MKKILPILLALPLLNINNTTRTEINSDHLIKIGALGAAAAVGYGIYHYIQHTIEEHIVDYIVDSIVLTCTATKKLSEDDKRKKAQLMCRRVRVMQELETIISKDHPYAKRFAALKNAFALIDRFRKPIVYEDEYKTPTILDKQIEKKIVASFMLSLKPDEQCTQQERAQKAKSEERRKKIIKKLHEKKVVPYTILDILFLIF